MMFNTQEHLRPINTYPSWKYALLVTLLVIGSIFALPNIYAPDPAIQITQENGELIEETLFTDIQSDVKAKGI